MAPIPQSPLAEAPNGILIPTRGVTGSMIQDGSSKTFIVCETREQGFNSWYDGTTAWTVGLLSATGNYHAPTTGLPVCDKRKIAGTNPLGLWMAAAVGSPGHHAMNFGSTADTPEPRTAFLASAGADQFRLSALADTSPSNTWGFGPSSEHPGVVMHLVADGRVSTLAVDIDDTFYMRMITRSGREPDTCMCCGEH